jgi:hypothetical protein
MNNPQPEKILLKIHWTNGRVQRIQRRKKSRVSAFLRRVNDSAVRKYSLAVTYQIAVDNFGRKIQPINEAECVNKSSVLYVLNCFIER